MLSQTQTKHSEIKEQDVIVLSDHATVYSKLSHIYTFQDKFAIACALLSVVTF